MHRSIKVNNEDWKFESDGDTRKARRPNKQSLKNK